MTAEQASAKICEGIGKPRHDERHQVQIYAVGRLSQHNTVLSSLSSKEIPTELLIYFIAMDNKNESENHGQINIDRLLEEKCQVGRYFNMRYSRLVEMLLEAENKGYISLNNNFGNRYIEFLDRDYSKLLEKYYMGKED